MSSESLTPEAIRAALEATCGPVSYADFCAMLERDAVFVVVADVLLVDCAVAIALDRVDEVRAWIEAGALRKPSLGERASWPLERERRWTSIVVQPFVLIQPLAAPDD